MLFHPCRGQAMVCTVVLSAAALASQTHYSYLNEFSRAPSTLQRFLPLASAASHAPTPPSCNLHPSLRSHESPSIFAITLILSLSPSADRSFRLLHDFATVQGRFVFVFFPRFIVRPVRVVSSSYLSPLGRVVALPSRDEKSWNVCSRRCRRRRASRGDGGR